MNGIRLHPEHGVNPTISQCIICGGDKNEIALLGASYKGQAPMKMVTSIEPCDACREKYLKNGVMIVEAEQKTNYRGDVTGHIPNGTFSIIKDSAFKKMFNVPVPKGKITYCEVGLLAKIGAVQ